MKFYYAIFFLAAFLCASINFCQTIPGNHYESNLALSARNYSIIKRHLGKVTVTYSVLPDDSLDLGTRFYSDEKSYSHVPLDFACIKKDVDTSSTIIINESCAVSIEEDPEWVKQQQDTLSEEDIETIYDDNAFYNYETHKALENAHIPVQYISREKQYITFIKADNHTFTIDLNWFKYGGWIIFNNKNNPELLNIFSVEEAIGEMFKK